MYRQKAAHSGMTLLELVVVVAIIAVLAMVAMPTYEEIVQRSRRSEAREALSDFAARQEQFFTDNKTYTGSTAALGRSSTTEEGYYRITVPSFTTTTYTLRATAQPPQDRDTACQVMEYTSAGNKTPVDCW